MKMPKFTLADARDSRVTELVAITDKKVLAVWALDCAQRTLHCFEDDFPEDVRPRKALEALQDWIDTLDFSMKVIRKASLDAHAAARDAGENTPARSAARAAGQAVATAHVKTHSPGAGMYAQQAVFLVSAPSDAPAAAAREREWQYRHLLELIEKG